MTTTPASIPTMDKTMTTMSDEELPDDIRVPLHELKADMKYLFGRVATDGSLAGAMADSVLEKLGRIEAALRSPQPSGEEGR